MADADRAAATSLDRGFFGHPRALATLFLTELWERFSYYGMRALLILFMTDAVTGMGMSEGRAAAIYGCTCSACTRWRCPAAGSPTACSASAGPCSTAAS